MATIDERSQWARWIWASTAKAVKTIADTLSLPLLVEGIDDRQKKNVEASHAELRLNGPFIFELSNRYYQVQMPINILLVDYMVGDSSDAYRLQRWAGTFQAALDLPISVYRYGTGTNDDESLVDCLRVRRTRDGGVRIIHFGQVARMGTLDTSIRETAIDGLFEMNLNPLRAV
jgi:hypothetical protein